MGPYKCNYCKSNVQRARRVAAAQDCEEWFNRKEKDNDQEWTDIMTEFITQCPASSGRVKPGQFDMTSYVESKVASSGLE
eukprot:9482601-Pyramimonas_sp.AAC.1